MDDAKKNSDTLHLEQQSKMLKEVEYYSALVSTWVNTRFEHDKSLMALSTGAIGLIYGFLISLKSGSWLIFFLSCFSLFLFCICLFTTLTIFAQNAEHIEAVISDDGKKHVLNEKLKCLDAIAKYSFIFGVIFSALTVLLYVFETSGLFETKYQSINTPAPTSNTIGTNNSPASLPTSTVKSVPLAFQVKNESNNIDTLEDSKQVNACSAGTYNTMQQNSTEGIEKLKPKSK